MKKIQSLSEERNLTISNEPEDTVHNSTMIMNETSENRNNESIFDIVATTHSEFLYPNLQEVTSSSDSNMDQLRAQTNTSKPKIPKTIQCNYCLRKFRVVSGLLKHLYQVHQKIYVGKDITSKRP